MSDKASNIAKNPKYDGFQRGLPSMVYIFFDKKKTCGSDTKNGSISNKELAADLQKPIIRTFENRKVHSLFTDNTWGTNPTDM